MSDVPFTLRDARESDLAYLNAYAAAEGMDDLPSAENVRVAVNGDDVPVGFLRLQQGSNGAAHVNPVSFLRDVARMGCRTRAYGRGAGIPRRASPRGARRFGAVLPCPGLWGAVVGCYRPGNRCRLRRLRAAWGVLPASHGKEDAMSWNTAFEVVSAAAAACRGCGACVPRCEVLACAGGADEPLSVGEWPPPSPMRRRGTTVRRPAQLSPRWPPSAPSLSWPCVAAAWTVAAPWSAPTASTPEGFSPPCGCFCTRHALRATTASR